MRKAQIHALKQTSIRVGIGATQLDELCQLVASTCGPLVISSMIEHGLYLFRLSKNKKRKTKKRKSS